MVLGKLLLNIQILFIFSILVLVRDIYGQIGLCRKAPLKSIIQANGNIQDYCEYIDGKNRMVMFPGSEFTKHCSICKCSFKGLQCCQISPTPKPESIPRGCVAILDGCVYRRVLASDRKTDCYKGLGIKNHIKGKQLGTMVKPQTKLASLPEVMKNKKVLHTKTQNPKTARKTSIQRIQRIQQKLQESIKQKQKLQQMQQNLQENKKQKQKLQQMQQKLQENIKQKQKLQQMQRNAKQRQMKENTKQSKNIPKKIQEKELVKENKTIPKDKSTPKLEKLPLNLNTSIQPFEVNSILNGKDTFLVISLKNKVSERSKPKKNVVEKQTPPPTEQGSPGESNQSEQQQELVAKLQRSLNGEYDFSMMDYYNMFSNFQQQTTPALNTGNEGTTPPTTTSGSAGNMFESNQVSVIAIKSSNTEFMKWLIDTLGNLGLINYSTNQTTNGTTHRDKLEMVLKQLVQNKTSSPEVNEFMTTHDSSPTYTFDSNKNEPPTHLTDVNKLVSVSQAGNNLGTSEKETTSTTPVSQTQNTGNADGKLTSKLKTKLLDNIIDKMVQDVLRKKLDSAKKPKTTPAIATTTVKTTEAPSGGGLFANIGLFGLGFLDSMSK